MVNRWEEISREPCFQKYSRKIEKVVFQLPDGTESDYYIKNEGQAVCVLAITDDNKVILAKQFRPGPKEILDELPGGGINKGETPQEAAYRELLEETGYEGKIQFVTTVYECAYSNIIRHCFVSLDCRKTNDQRLDKTEFIETTLVDLEQFRQNIRQGRMTDIEVAYLCLDHLSLL